MIARLLNISRAIIRFPRFLIALIKSKPVSIYIASFRLRICNECDDLDLLTRQCKHCWCFVRLKVQWEDERCPIGKWEDFK